MKYVYYALIVMFIYFVGNDIYQQTNKKGARSTRLACQKECKVFEKVYKEDLLEKAKLALKGGNYELDSSIKKVQGRDIKKSVDCAIESFVTYPQ